MKLRKWNYKTHKYDPYEVPDEWVCLLDGNNMDKQINCASCGKKMRFGDSYTSREIHNDVGIGYGVCKQCFQAELEREKKGKMKYKVIKKFYRWNVGGVVTLDISSEDYEITKWLLEKGYLEEIKQPEKTGLGWRTKPGEEYWFIDHDGEVAHTTWRGSKYDAGRLAMGNYFKTEAEATAFRDHEMLEKKLVRAGLSMGGREKCGNGNNYAVRSLVDGKHFWFEGLYFDNYEAANEFLQPKYQKELEEWAAYFTERGEE